MTEASGKFDQDPGRAGAAPLVVLAFALFVYTRALGWGLPAGDETWAADALKPSAPLAVAWNSFLAHGWNSGWFWFKYPPFHAFLLCAVYAPYLAWLWATGDLGGLSSEYPYGLTDPEASLSTLAWLGRLTTAAMGAGCVVLVYHLLRRGFGAAAAAGAAFAVTMAYPMVYYAQTTNVEVPYLFWMLLALLAAVRLVDGDARARWWMLLGAGTALSVSTKELAAGAFVGVPVVLVASSLAAGRPAATWLRGGLVAAAAFVAAMLVANNALYNPLGFAHRLGFLTQSLPKEVALQYAPYYFPIDLGAGRSLAAELAQLSLAASRLQSSLGTPMLLLSLAGWVLALRRRPTLALLLAGVVATYYLVSVRAMLSLSLRYLLPITVLCSAMAGLALAELLRPGRLRGPRALLAGAAALYVFAYGWDVNRMMTGDGRYAARQWLEAAPAGASVEIYQRPTYLPHFPEHLAVAAVPFEERGTTEFRRRAPDLVVVSSSGRSGITVRYKKDWQDEGESATEDGAAAPDGWSPAQKSIRGDVMNYSRDANVEFLDALTGGSLGYEVAERFGVDPWIERARIQSLNPRITIYRRPGFAGTGATEQ